MVPLQQRKEDLGLISFEVGIDANSRASSPGIGAAPLLGIAGTSSPGIAITPGVAGASSPGPLEHLCLRLLEYHVLGQRSIIDPDHWIITVWDRGSTRIF